MSSRNIEMMHHIAGEIGVLHDIGGGADIELKAQAALLCFAPRLQAYFPPALANRRLVTESRCVPDGIDHRKFSIHLCHQSRFDRIIKVDLMDRVVGLRTLPADAVHVSDGAGCQNFFDLAEAESGPHPASQSCRLRGFSLS